MMIPEENRGFLLTLRTRMTRASIVLFALVCVFLGYLLIWERGLYMDDYSERNKTVNIVTGVYRPSLAPWQARYLALSLQRNLAGLAETYELPIRGFFTGMITLNAALLAWLVYRMLRSLLAAVVSGWLFATPFIAFEATLWLMTLGLYVPGVFFMLVFLHGCLSALATERRADLWAALALAAYIIAILFLEQTALVAFGVPLLASAVASNGSSARVRLVRSFVLGVTALALAGLVFGLLYMNNSPLVQLRGSLDFDPAGVLQRLPLYYKRFVWMVIDRGWGLHLTGDAFTLGLDAIRSSPVGMALAGAAGVLLTLTVWFWQCEYQQTSPWRAEAVLVAGALWFVATIVVPGIFVKGQIIEYRMLYVPLAGACAAAGALVWLVTRRLDRPAVQKAVLALSGLVALFSTVCLTGYCRAYAERYALDQHQIAALRLALPGEMLPTNAYIILLDADYSLFDRKETISRVMMGVFEQPWSSRAAIQQAYRRSDLQSLTGNKWAPIRISYQTAQPGGQVVLRVQGTPVPFDRTIFFTYRNGRVQIYELLALSQKSGPPQLVPLPLAQHLRHQEGLPTVATIPAPQVEHIYSSTGDLETVKLLLDAGVEINARSRRGSRALIDASWAGKQDVVLYLLDSGADVNGTASGGFTALSAAINQKQEKVALLLLERGAKPNIVDPNGSTPLIEAAWQGSLPMVKALLSKGAALNYRRPDNGFSALKAAVASNKKDIVQELKRAGATE